MKFQLTIFIACQHTDVCLSLFGIVWKRLNVSSQFLQHTAAQSF